MTLAEFLQQVLARCNTPGIGVGITLTQITGDPRAVDSGQVWIAQGGLSLSNDGETFQSTLELIRVIPPPPPGPLTRFVSLSLNINSGTMAIHTVNEPGGLFADHLQLQYFNGVLYGTATHFAIIGPPPFSFEVVPGPVFTLTFSSGQIIP